MEKARVAYRVFDNDTIAPIGSEVEREVLEQAFADLAAAEFHGARAHLRSAAEQLTAGRWADSIRESIHAVESVTENARTQRTIVRGVGEAGSVGEHPRRDEESLPVTGLAVSLYLGTHGHRSRSLSWRFVTLLVVMFFFGLFLAVCVWERHVKPVVFTIAEASLKEVLLEIPLAPTTTLLQPC